MRRSSQRCLLAAVAAWLAAACASQGAPPGGPVDTAPPKLVRTTPDTGARGVSPSSVAFRFDEVIAERPSGGELSQLVLLSPSDGPPRISWERKGFTVRPRRSFRPNTAYTVTVLPGISDLRNNASREGWSLTFSTGGEIPGTRLDGVVFDWAAGRPAVRATVQAFPRGDTTFSWIARTDSSGRFSIRAFPSGSYLVRAFVDANNNRALDPRELWDSTGAAIADSAGIELYAFVHDTIGPRADVVSVEDSVTLRVTLDKPVHPAVPVAAAQFRVAGSDSVSIGVVALLTDSAYNAERGARRAAGADSTARRDTAARRDTTRARARPSPTSRVPLPGAANRAPPADTTPAPRMSRPTPQSRFLLRLAAPLGPARNYRLYARDLRNLSGALRTSDKVFTTPRPAASDSTRVPGTTPSTTPRPAPAAPPPG